MKVLSVVGNRPQFIKSAPLSVALREAGIEEVVLHTGQHYDRELSQVFFDELGLARAGATGSTCAPPTRRRCGPGSATAVERERPDWVLVFGDTNSTLAGAAGRRRRGRAGRARRGGAAQRRPRRCPRSATGSRSTGSPALLLCPDERSRATARGEGVAGRIEVVGDVMADACSALRADRARALGRARAARARAGRLRRSPRSTARRTCSRSGCAAHRRRARPARRAGRLPGPPAHARRARRPGSASATRAR